MKLDTKQKLKVQYKPIKDIRANDYNPRSWSQIKTDQLKESISKFGVSDPLVVNKAKGRENVLISGHFRLHVAKQLGYTEVPVVEVEIPDIKLEKELCLRFNKNVGDWDWGLLAEYDETLLEDVGFSSDELDSIFNQAVDTPEEFNIDKELEKLDIDKVEVKKGDIWQLGDHTLMCGDSTIPAHFKKLMGDVKADMSLTDPPYILDYIGGKTRNGTPTEKYGLKKERKYLETDVLPPDFTEKWMQNVANHAKDDFAIIVYENWKNIPVIWEEMAKHWRIKNMLVWHIAGRHQNFAAKHKFFNRHDIAMVGAKGDVEYNLDSEEGGLQEEYETALFAIAGDPHWEGYKKDGDFVPTDFIDFDSADDRHSGQGIIFGTKPLEVLIPYLKVLTRRGDVVIEPFGGSGSTLIACEKLKRTCYLMEKVPTYAQVIIKRWETLTGQKAKRLHGADRKEANQAR